MPGHARELGHRKMRQRARPRRAVAEGAGLLLRQRLEFLEGLGRHLGRERDHLRRVADRRDRHQILQRVERHRLLDEGIDDEIAVEREAERGAVGRGLGDRIHAERAGRAGAVLDHRLLAGGAGDVLGQEPRAEVADAAGGEAGDDAHGLARPVLRRCGAGSRAPRARSGHAVMNRTIIRCPPRLRSSFRPAYTGRTFRGSPKSHSSAARSHLPRSAAAS